MRRIVLLLPFALSACVVGSGAPTPLAPLAQDRAQPRLALFEHVLTGYFSRVGSLGPTVCAESGEDRLDAAEERELTARFVRLAPHDRCQRTAQGLVDGITQDRAEAVSVYQFACSGETQCTGWAQVPGMTAMRYAMRYTEGEWHFDADPRAIAE